MKTRLTKRLMSMFVCVAMLMSYAPITAAAANYMESAQIVVDPGTADAWEHMMGTATDGNRYAGRVWVDKSVYKNGDTVKLNSRGESGSSFQVSLEDDEAFQVIFSALGSTMTTKSTVTSSSPMDVVLILDTSTSMDETEGGATRLQRVIEAANTLIDDLLTMQNMRIAVVTYNKDSETVLPLAAYNNGVDLVVTNYYNNGRAGAGVVTAYDSDRTVLGRDSGYTMGTNLQSGIDRGFGILANAADVRGRTPVAIVLTDGQANRATRERFYDVINAQDKDGTGTSGSNLYLSTLLNAAYSKAKVEAHYGRAQRVYGIGVDLDDNTTAQLLMNPGDARNGFNATNSAWDVRIAYSDFQKWSAGQTVTNNGWTFNHDYPTVNGAITRQKIADNINYVDTYYDVSGAKLEDTFDQIYVELASSAFNPISSSTTVDGATGVDNTPLIYVDFIGQHMEVKEIEAITLFGASYGIVNNGDGTYSVAASTGVNPTTNERWSTTEDIKIQVTRQTDGTQKLEIRINQEILPILVEQVESKTVGEETSATITEISYDPLRVYYTVGLDSNILLPNGDVDVSKIQGYGNIDNANGTVSFYSNQFGVMNAAENGVVMMGDAHVGFQPSAENRYYYYQTNQGVFTKIIDKDTGKNVTIPENLEYGIVWDENEYELTWMSYAEYLAAADTDKVYTYVTYYHPTASTTDAATAAEEVTYLVYADWKYLKNSVAFYDATAEKYVNYDAANGYVVADEGTAIPSDDVADVIAAYKRDNANAEIYAVLGVGAMRTSRLHNMEVFKDPNNSATAMLSYAPVFLHSEQDHQTHHDNNVVVWLGNSGKLTVEVDTGIALTKQVTEAIGNANDTYAVTVTVPDGVAATPVVVDANGNDVTTSISIYQNNVLTVNLKAGQTVYVSGIPGGTVCTIGENIPSGAEYYISDKTDTVTVPTLEQALNGTAQFVQATVTNAPNKYGNLSVVKNVLHHLPETPEAMQSKAFTFKVQLPVALARETYTVDKTNASLFTENTVAVGDDGSFTVELKANESITILGLPVGTAYTVTETSVVPGYENTTSSVSGTISAGEDNDAHFINTYSTTPIKPAITVTGTKTLVDTHNTYTGNEQFQFVLSQYVGDAYVSLGTTKIAAGESYSFDLAALLTAELDLGDHYFRVTETAGTTPGMTYDSTRGLFAVKVTDTNADGTLEYTIENYANTTVNGNTITKHFTNTYDVERTHVDVEITKTLTNTTGVNVPLDIFHFELVNTDNASDRYTATTDASGKATIRIADLAAGTYQYKLTEVNGGMPGMAYDNTEYIVNITVTANAAQLVAVAEVQGTAVNGDDTVAVSFRNTYTLAPTKHTISGKKTLNGRDPQNDEFVFALYETDSSFVIGATPKDTAKNVGKTFTFDELSYSKVGTYYYSVKEIVGTVPGVTYDTTHYHVTVTVGIDSQDKTKLAVTDVSVNKIGTNSDTTGDIVFVNNYKATPTSYQLGGHKTLKGRAMQAGEFTFALYEGDTWIETVTNKADGSFTFASVTYTEAGTHTYTIKELEPAEKAPGVTYNGVSQPVTVTVTVTDTNSILSAQANVSNANIQFENTYTAKSAQVTFNGTKTLKGANLADNSFTFRLYKTDHFFDITNSEAELISTASNVNGAFSFERIFNAAGTYFFVVLEDATVDTKENVVYDRTEHKFTIRVSDVGDGQLKATVTNVNTGVSGLPAASATADVAFVNATFDEVTEKEVYLAGSVTTHIDGKKVNAGDVLTYFITYTNYTGEDVEVDIMDTIPKHTSYVEGTASHGGTYAGTHLNWILHVARGESVTVSFDVKVDDTEAIMANTAVVLDGVNTYKTNEVVNHTVEKELVKEVYTPADVTVNIDGKKVNAGDELIYKISFTNATPNTADIQITDKIPANTTYVAGSADNSGVYRNGEIRWELNDVPAWTTVTVAFKVTVNANVVDGVIENQAYATDGTNNYTTNTVANPTEKPTDPSNPTDPTDPTNPKPGNPGTPSNPKTGDDTQLQLWLALLAVSGGGIFGTLLCGRKKKETEEE